MVTSTKSLNNNPGIEVIEEVTEIRLGAGRAKLAFALACRRRATASLHSVFPGIIADLAKLSLFSELRAPEPEIFSKFAVSSLDFPAVRASETI